MEGTDHTPRYDNRPLRHAHTYIHIYRERAVCDVCGLLSMYGCVGGKNRHLGAFEDETEAALAFDR